MQKKTLANGLRTSALCFTVAAMGAIGLQAFNPDLIETEIELAGETIPLEEAVMHAGMLAGMLQLKGADKLDPQKKKKGPPGSGGPGGMV